MIVLAEITINMFASIPKANIDYGTILECHYKIVMKLIYRFVRAIGRDKCASDGYIDDILAMKMKLYNMHTYD